MNIILFVHNLEGSGGTERMTIFLANELDKLGYRISIVTLGFCSKSFFPLNDNIPLFCLKQSKNKILKYFINIYSLRKFIKQLKPQIFINVCREMILRSLPACLGIKCKFIVWEHSNILNMNLLPGTKPARFLTTHFSDIHILLSKTNSDYCKNKYGEKQATFIYNPFLIEGEIEISNLETRKVLFVGRLSPDKGYEQLLQVWALVNKKHPDWELDVVGQFANEKVKEHIEILSQKLNLNNINFHKPTNNIAKFYKNSAMLASTSNSILESFPLVFIEAKSFGLPIVSFNWGANCKELVNDGYNGFIIENFDVEKMSEKICELIENTELRKQIGRVSLEDSKKYDKHAIMKQWENLLNGGNENV